MALQHVDTSAEYGEDEEDRRTGERRKGEEKRKSSTSVLDLLSQLFTLPAAVEVPHTNGTVD